MLNIIIVALCSVSFAVATLQWKNCVSETTDAAVTIHQFEAPTHIIFPSQVHFTLNMTFNRKLTQVYVDFDIIRYFLEFPLSLPCKTGTIIGTCVYRDMCNILDLSVGYIPDHPDYYGYKFQAIMNATMNHYLECPIKEGNLFIKDQVFELAEIPSYVHLLADGDYTIRIHAKENATAPIIGCIEVNVTIGGQDAGASSLFG